MIFFTQKKNSNYIKEGKLVNAFVKDPNLSLDETIDTLVYSKAQDQYYEFATAVGLFKNVINFLLLIFANTLTKKINGYSMYSLD